MVLITQEVIQVHDDGSPTQYHSDVLTPLSTDLSDWVDFYR